jgi:N-methylhydantoinase B
MSVQTDPQEAVAPPADLLDQTIYASVRALARQLDAVVEGRSRSPAIADNHDYSTGVFHADGRLVENFGSPIHIMAATQAVGTALARFPDLAGGDIVVVGDPYFGGSHHPDLIVFAPVEVEGRIELLLAVRGHHADVGGGAAGSINPKSRDVWEDGFRVPPLRLWERGTARADLVELLLANSRLPEWYRDDLAAMRTALERVASNAKRLLTRWSPDRVRLAIERTFDRTRRLVEAELERWPAGPVLGPSVCDHDLRERVNVRSRARVEVTERRLRVDFEGTDEQVPGAINSPFANSRTYVHMALLAALGGWVPRNHGFLSCVDVSIPEGSFLNPTPPASTSFSTIEAGAEAGEAMTLALSQLVPERTATTHARAVFVVTHGMDSRTRKPYAIIGLEYSACPCGGGYPGVDGWALPLAFAQQYAANVETSELSYPVLWLERELETDGAAPGRWRGAIGIRARYRVLDDARANVFLFGSNHPQGGVAGGDPGLPNRAILRPGTAAELRLGRHGAQPVDELGSLVQYDVELPANSEVVVWRMGGGGWGPPDERDPDQVREDVLDDVVSVAGARDRYAVALDPETLEIDRSETARLRSSARVRRGAAG